MYIVSFQSPFTSVDYIDVYQSDDYLEAIRIAHRLHTISNISHCIRVSSFYNKSDKNFVEIDLTFVKK